MMKKSFLRVLVAGFPAGVEKRSLHTVLTRVPVVICGYITMSKTTENK